MVAALAIVVLLGAAPKPTATTKHSARDEAQNVATAHTAASARGEMASESPEGSADARPFDNAHSLRFNVAHGFSRLEARRRIEQLCAYWHERFGVRTSWIGDRARVVGDFLGVHFNAELEVKDDAVAGIASDPGLLLRESSSRYILGKL